MRKHFLILMLMALLPLAGWAQTATFGDASVGEYTYGGADLPAVVVKDSENAILTEGTHYTVSATAYKNEACTTSVNKEAMEGGVTYYLKITGAGAYVGQTRVVHFTCKFKELTVSVTQDLNRDYGSNVEPDLDDSWTVTGLVTTAPWSDTKDELGTLEYTYAGQGDPDYAGGEYTITFSGLSSKYYDIKYPTNKKFTINGTDISGETVTVKPGTAFADKTYKGAAYVANDLTGLVLMLGETELVQGTDFTITKGTTGNWKTVGNHSYNVVFKGNYAGTKANFATFKIVQAPLSVGVEDITETYKSAAYTNTFSATPTLKWYGFVGEDVANKATLIAGITNKPSVSVKQEGGATNVGDYELQISGGATPDGSNYKITNYLTNGQLHIEAAEVSLFANEAEKGPGAADPTFTLKAATFKGEDYIDATTVTFTREEGEVVGESYDITPVLTNAKIYNGTGAAKTDVTSNYDLKIGTPKAQLTIKKATLTITILDQDKFYGDADPATIAAPVKDQNYIVTGLVAGDAVTSVTLKKSWNNNSNAGNYILDATVVYTGAEHYTGLVVVPGNFEIKKAPLTVTLPIKSVAAGITPDAALATLTKAGITITGFKKNETVANTYDLSLDPALTTTAGNLDNQSNAGGYILTLKDAIFVNYAITGGTAEGKKLAGKLIVGDGSGDDLDLTTAASVAANIATLEAEVADVNMPDLALNAKEWYAVVLPFKTTPEELVNELNTYVVVDKIKNSTMDAAGVVTVNFEMEWDEIPAGTPFLIKPAKATNWNVTAFANKLVVKAITAKATDKATFTGTYVTGEILQWGKDLDGTTAKEGAAYRWLAHKEYKGDNNWKNPKSTPHALTPLEAYLVLDSEATGARIFVEDFENGTTAIKEFGVDGTNKAYSVDGWYTLNGVKLQGAPTEKGVYINNGKKVVIK